MTELNDNELRMEKHDKRDENLYDVDAEKSIAHEFNPPPTPTAFERGHYSRMMSFPGITERKRVRTESLCSNKSTAITKDLQKIRRLDDFGGKTSSRQPNRADILKKDKAHLTMKDMIYYNPTTNPMLKQDKNAKKETVIKEETVKEERIKTPEPPKPAAPFVPQLKLGPNGEMILDEQSLVVQSTAEKEAQRVLQNAEIVYEDSNNGGRYGYFKRQKRTKDWSPEETIKFYRCLHTVGTDFSLMLQLFPNRTRRELKIKFKKEEKNNGHLIDKAILSPKEFDIDALKRELEEEETERIRKEEETRSRVEEENSLRKTLSKGRIEELKAMKKTSPHRWLSKTNRSLVEADAVYKAADLANGGKRRRRNRQALTNTVAIANRYEQKKDVEPEDLTSPKRLSQSQTDTETDGEVTSQEIKLEEPESETKLNSTHSFSQDSDLLSDSCTQEESGDDTDTKSSIVKIEPTVLQPLVKPTASPSVETSTTTTATPISATTLTVSPDSIDSSSSTRSTSQSVITSTAVSPPVTPSTDKPDDGNKIDIDDVDLDSLVMCSVLDAKGEVTYQVFIQDPVTGKLGEQPLDLDKEIIDILRSNMADK